MTDRNRLKRLKPIISLLLSLYFITQGISYLKSEDLDLEDDDANPLFIQVDCSKVGNLDDNKAERAMLMYIKDVLETVRQSFRPYLNCLEQDDPQLIQKIKDEYIIHPNNDPYKLDTEIEEDGFDPLLADIIRLVFKRKSGVPRQGFFIEAGSYDGEKHSITLDLEYKFGWKGLLVEADAGAFWNGLMKNRKVLSVNTCIGIQSKPHYAFYDLSTALRRHKRYSMGGIVEITTMSTIPMQCLPLYSLIAAAGNPTINLLVLGVEGAELAILKTLPWDKVDIEVLSLETDLVGLTVSGGSQAEIRSFVESKGYQRFPHSHSPNFLTNLQQNDIFVRNDIVKKYKVVP